MQLSENYKAQAKSKGVTVPAIDLAMTYSLTDNNGGVWKGYLGSKQQWELTWANINELNATLSAIFGDDVTMWPTDWKWTSTQANSGGAWSFGTDFNASSKGTVSYVVPFFLLSINN